MRFEIASPRRAFEALSHPAMDESEDNTILGHLEIDGDRLGETEPATSDLPARPEAREMMNQLMARHYEDWVSEELPALGGLTPLEAAVFRKLRERLGLV